MKIGYVRVSKEEQNPEYQHDALRAAGCEQVFEDRVSGAEFSRTALDQALAAVKEGGEFVVWKLDRVGRSMLETVQIVVDLDRRGIAFRSVTEPYFDTKTPIGRGILALVASVAEDERETLRQRTRAGIAAARRRGKRPGRPPKLTPDQLDYARERIGAGDGRAVMARKLGVDPSTLRRLLNA